MAASSTNDATPAGSRKYLLVQPDTFDLLVKNFDQVQRIKHQPAIRWALEFEKQILLIKQSKKNMAEKQAALSSLYLRYTDRLSQLYKVKEWCEEGSSCPPPAVVAAENKPAVKMEEKTSDDDEFAYVVPNRKKAKWVSFRK